jgi:DNA-binding NarL/FixJ family response regulator
MTTASETAEWLDGPQLVDWLEQHGMETASPHGYSTERAVQRWKKGGRANVYAADQVLTQVGCHLHELPEEMWIDAPLRGPKISGKTREEMLRRLEAGEKIKPLAKELSLSPSTVRYHRDRARMYAQKPATDHKRPSLAGA